MACMLLNRIGLGIDRGSTGRTARTPCRKRTHHVGMVWVFHCHPRKCSQLGIPLWFHWCARRSQRGYDCRQWLRCLHFPSRLGTSHTWCFRGMNERFQGRMLGNLRRHPHQTFPRDKRLAWWVQIGNDRVECSGRRWRWVPVGIRVCHNWCREWTHHWQHACRESSRCKTRLHWWRRTGRVYSRCTTCCLATVGTVLGNNVDTVYCHCRCLLFRARMAGKMVFLLVVVKNHWGSRNTVNHTYHQIRWTTIHFQWFQIETFLVHRPCIDLRWTVLSP